MQLDMIVIHADNVLSSWFANIHTHRLYNISDQCIGGCISRVMEGGG